MQHSQAGFGHERMAARDDGAHATHRRSESV
jgi:hypothetical protein